MVYAMSDKVRRALGGDCVGGGAAGEEGKEEGGEAHHDFVVLSCSLYSYDVVRGEEIQ